MKKQKKGSSVQDLLGIKTFTRYGLSTTSGELVFYLVNEVKRVARLSVHFVDERKYRDMAHNAHLEQLSCLRLNAL